MKFVEENSSDSNFISSYSRGSITIGDSAYSSSLIVAADKITQWPPQSCSDLQIEDISRLLEFNPELVLIGTGAAFQQLGPDLIQPLTKHLVGCEIMDTPAACRTYNVLLAEGRRVAAALIMA